MAGIKPIDLAIVGTGSAASTAAFECRAAGWTVAVVDRRPYGGTCALRGCDPKKVLVGAASLLDWLYRMDGKGVRPDHARIGWPDLIRFKRTFTDPVPEEREERFRKAGIDTFHGVARFTGPTQLQVGDETLQGRRILVAAGAKPEKLNIPGEQYLTSSEEFLELDSLPPRIIFVGGGYISFEFAHVSARSAREVQILHRGDRPLERFDPDLVEQLVERTRQAGVKVHLRTKVESVEPKTGHLAVWASSEGGKHEFHADLVVHGAGRVADLDDLDLAQAGIESERSGIKVNEYLQSVSNPAIYAAGDAAASGLPPLTPVAVYEGTVVAANLLRGNHQKLRHKSVPTVVFTTPPLASVGMSEQVARQNKLRFRIHREKTGSWYSSRRVAEACSGSKILIEEGTGRILGAHLLGPEADELINLFALAIETGSTAETLKRVIFAYPTHASDLEYML
jgi:glutathione reductase (NADPH)